MNQYFCIMKKTFILITLAFLLCVVSYAQQTPVKRTEEYCELRTKRPLFSGKLVAEVDYGDGDKVLKDEQGKSVEFSSAIGVLNYMNSLGWELLNVHVWVNDGDGYTYYVMKRKLE